MNPKITGSFLKYTTQIQYERIQQKIMSLFKEGESFISEYVYVKNNLNKTRKDFHDFSELNVGEEITDNSVANITREKRLKKRLWFTIVLEAVLSIMAIKFFLAQMLAFDLQWTAALALGIFLTAIILELAIEMRIDDAEDQDNGSLHIIRKWSYLLPLIFIPGLNIFIITSTPDSSLNILFSFFALFSILMNLKTASNWNQYKILKQSKIANSKIKKYEGIINKNEKILYNLAFNKMQPLNNKITAQATKLRSIYESRGDNVQGKLFIPVKYIIILNNLIFHTDVFPVPQLNLTSPPDGDLKTALESWNNTIFKQPLVPQRRLDDRSETSNMMPQQNEHVLPKSNFNSSNDNYTGNDLNNQNYEDETTPKVNSNDNSGTSDLDQGIQFGIPDNEKYV